MVSGPYAEAPGEAGGAIQILPIRGIPEVRSGDDLPALIQSGCATTELTLQHGDVVVVSSKVLSKAAGLWADTRADAVDRSTLRVVAERATSDGVTQVVEAVAGPVMAAGGVDASNTGGSDRLLLLPPDPDAAAATLLAGLLQVTQLPVGSLGVVVTDTAGRPWRAGQTDFALGAAGVLVLDDLRGRLDADGRPLAVTARAVADEVAAAADLVKGKARAVPAAVVRGLSGFLSPAGAPRHGAPVDAPASAGARSLVRVGASDWFQMGHLEAVRAALGVEPGSQASAAVGVRPLHWEPVPVRVERLVRLALTGDGCAGVVDRVEVEGSAITIRGDDEFGLGVAMTRLVVGGWTEQVAVTAAERAPGLVRLTVTDLVPLPQD